MYGLQTIRGINARNAQAQAILAKHEPQQLPHGDGVKKEQPAPAPITE